MKIWILIIIFGYRGGVTTAEFNSESACQYAVSQITKLKIEYAGTGVNAVCVPKGETNK